jgi:4-carboxymuconolactone decarboxylase
MGDSIHERGMRIRRKVLGDDYVDAAVSRTTDFTADFQDLITRYVWGEIWTRPGLDLRQRSCITLTALVALGRLEELEMHVTAALRNGLTVDDIKEVLLQSAIYCGVPAANAPSPLPRASTLIKPSLHYRERAHQTERPGHRWSRQLLVGSESLALMKHEACSARSCRGHEETKPN